MVKMVVDFLKVKLDCRSFFLCLPFRLMVKKGEFVVGCNGLWFLVTPKTIPRVKEGYKDVF